MNSISEWSIESTNVRVTNTITLPSSKHPTNNQTIKQATFHWERFNHQSTHILFFSRIRVVQHFDVSIKQAISSLMSRWFWVWYLELIDVKDSSTYVNQLAGEVNQSDISNNLYPAHSSIKTTSKSACNFQVGTFILFIQPCIYNAMPSV